MGRTKLEEQGQNANDCALGHKLSLGFLMSIKLALQDRLLRKFNGNLKQRFLDLIQPKASDKLLDVGGGTGALAELMKPSYESSVVLDPDPSKLKFGARRRPDVNFVLGVAEYIPFPAQCFGSIVAVGSFHHLQDQEQGLEEFRRVSVRDGFLGMLEYDLLTSTGKIAKFIDGLLGNTKWHFLDPKQLGEKVQQHGFDGVLTSDFTRGYILTAKKKLETSGPSYG